MNDIIPSGPFATLIGKQETRQRHLTAITELIARTFYSLTNRW